MAEKKKRKIGSLIATFVFIVAGTFLLVSSVTVIYERFTLSKQAEAVSQELQRLEEEKEELSSIKSKLEDENYVVTYARGEYMFSKGDEKLFKLPNK